MESVATPLSIGLFFFLLFFRLCKNMNREKCVTRADTLGHPNTLRRSLTRKVFVEQQKTIWFSLCRLDRMIFLCCYICAFTKKGSHVQMCVACHSIWNRASLHCCWFQHLRQSVLCEDNRVTNFQPYHIDTTLGTLYTHIHVRASSEPSLFLLNSYWEERKRKCGRAPSIHSVLSFSDLDFFFFARIFVPLNWWLWLLLFCDATHHYSAFGVEPDGTTIPQTQRERSA